MLLNLRQYFRPSGDGPEDGLAQALELLARPDVRTVPLAGGDTLVGSSDPSVEAVVDLQALGLDELSLDPGLAALSAKAMVTRSRLAALVQAALPSPGPASHAYRDTPLRIIAAGAKRWGGSVQRNRATLGGALAVAAADDPLVVALLACDARVLLCGRDGYQTLPLVEFLPVRKELLARPALITDVVVPMPPGRLTGYGLADVARTPSDRPIVVAAAMLSFSYGVCRQARLALGGVAPHPIRIPEAEALLTDQPLTVELIAAAAQRAAELVQPADDFRGSAEYRQAMAGVLSERALREAWHAAE
ncbi:MAG: FAD binding domain-containing protein [Anaerolineae bacterium]|nr:FAD binding domain-containing protein [Anaerolineae bacterium]